MRGLSSSCLLPLLDGSLGGCLLLSDAHGLSSSSLLLLGGSLSSGRLLLPDARSLDARSLGGGGGLLLRPRLRFSRRLLSNCLCLCLCLCCLRLYCVGHRLGLGCGALAFRLLGSSCGGSSLLRSHASSLLLRFSRPCLPRLLLRFDASGLLLLPDASGLGSNLLRFSRRLSHLRVLLRLRQCMRLRFCLRQCLCLCLRLFLRVCLCQYLCLCLCVCLRLCHVAQPAQKCRLERTCLRREGEREGSLCSLLLLPQSYLRVCSLHREQSLCCVRLRSLLPQNS